MTPFSYGLLPWIWWFSVPFLCVTDASPDSKSNRVINMNPKLGKWPGGQVPFYMDPSYSADQKQQMRLSMLRVMGDTDMCVRFIEVDPNDPRYKVKIAPSAPEEVGSPVANLCHTFAGVYLPGIQARKNEQTMVLANGPDGCFDGTMHSLMKYLAVLLGLRNEHQRPDRDNFITVARNNVKPDLQIAYQVYPNGEIYISCPYDLCSITHNQPQDFAIQGMPAFTVNQAPFFVPKLNQLSTCDCMQLKALYGCDPSTCRQINCANQTVSTTASPAGTTVCYTVPPGGSTTPFTTTIPAAGSFTTTPSPTSCTVTASVTASFTTPDVPFGDEFTRRRRRELSFTEGKAMRMINADPDYLKWSRNTVPYYIDPAYTTEQRSQIVSAIQFVMTDMQGCIQFVEVPPAAPIFKLKITPFDGNSQSQGICHTFPGVSKLYAANGATEQPMILSTGSNGCFDDSVGNLMKYFILVLGRRNEHQRPDRDQFIDVNFDNIQPGLQSAYTKYPTSSASALPFPYDYCSITHNEPDDFALPGKAAFTFKNPQITNIPRLDQISQYDCSIVSVVYGCPASSCVPLDCSASMRAEEGPSPDIGQEDPSPNANAGDIPTPPPGLFEPFTPTIPAIVTPNPDGSSQICLQMPPSSSVTQLTAVTVTPPSSGSGSPTAASVIATTTCAPGASPTGLIPLNQLYQQLQDLVNQLQQQLSSLAGSTTTAATAQASEVTLPVNQQLMQQLDAIIVQLQQQISRQSTASTSGQTGSTSPTSAGTATTTTTSAATTTTSAITTTTTETTSTPTSSAPVTSTAAETTTTPIGTTTTIATTSTSGATTGSTTSTPGTADTGTTTTARSTTTVATSSGSPTTSGTATTTIGPTTTSSAVSSSTAGGGAANPSTGSSTTPAGTGSTAGTVTSATSTAADTSGSTTGSTPTPGTADTGTPTTAGSTTTVATSSGSPTTPGTATTTTGPTSTSSAVSSSTAGGGAANPSTGSSTTPAGTGSTAGTVASASGPTTGSTPTPGTAGTGTTTTATTVGTSEAVNARLDSALEGPKAKEVFQQLGTNLNGMLGQVNGVTDSGGKQLTQSYKDMHNGVKDMIEKLSAFTKGSGAAATVPPAMKEQLSEMEKSVQQLIEKLSARTSTTKKRTTKRRRGG